MLGVQKIGTCGDGQQRLGISFISYPKDFTFGVLVVLWQGDIMIVTQEIGYCGRLANQMFQVATTISYAIDNNMQVVFPILQDTDLQGNYRNNIFICCV